MAIFIGDIHDASKDTEFPAGSIQVGDLSSFPYSEWADFKEPRFFIDGNHEYFPDLNEDASAPYEIHGNLFHIPRGYVNNHVLFIGGGYSVDNYRRKILHDWFPDREQLNYQQLDKISSIQERIDVVVAHDCPFLVWMNYFHIQHGSSHSKALQLIFEKFHPSMWIFGHHHKNVLLRYEGCEFLGLGKHQIIDIPDIELEII